MNGGDIIEKNIFRPSKRFYNHLKREREKTFKIERKEDSLLSVFNFICFYNLVKSYEDELIELMNDIYTINLFDEKVRRRLFKQMVIIPITGKYGTYSYPSCLTRIILSGLIDEGDYMKLVNMVTETKEGKV